MKKNFLLLLQIIVAVCISVASFAQETTATLGGQVTDSKGGLISGVTVSVKHVPTGFTTQTQTNNKGLFYVSNLQSGGPYTVTFTYVGRKTEKREDYNLSLGSNSLSIRLLDESSNLNEVVVKTKTGNLKTGTGVQIGERQIKTMPTINRSLQDVTRVTPQSNNNSFAGTNFRYNNVTVDGAINNDAIGFSPSLGGQSGVSGQPGSSTRTNPFSLDAIQDVQVYIAPYDVKIGNFLGGSVNAVTRSGTNELHGSAYAFGRSPFMVGKNNAPANAGGDKSKEPLDFYDYQTGVRFGFPILKNKLFFFTNEEISHRVDPVISGAGSTASSIISLQQAQQIADTMKAWGAGDVGAYGNTTIYSKSTKLFNRLDWVINDKNRLSIRNNTVFSEATNLERDNANFRFGGIDFKQTNNQSSTVAELKSKFSNSVSNSLIVGYSNIHDYRDPLSNPALPQIQIKSNGGVIYLGTDREGSIFNMKQKTFEFTDNVTIVKGNNTFTFGTHNELYNITYGFVNSWNGRVDYNSVTDFLNNNPARVRTNFNYSDNTRDGIMANPPAKFKVNMYSVYGEDEIRLGKLKITPGLRVDLAQMPNKQPLSNKTTGAPGDAYYGTSYTYTKPKDIQNDFLGKAQISPRLGFNYDVNGNQSFIIRGGTGLFTGRIPFAWLGYAYYNNGVTYGAYDNRSSTTPFKPGTNPVKDAINNGNIGEAGFVKAQGLPVNDATGATQVDLIDNNFKMPQAWRSSLAFDYTTPSKWKFTIEGIYTKVVEDLKFQQINYIDTPKYLIYDVNHLQPIYSGKKINSKYTNAYLLSNTDQGYRYSITAQVSKAFDFGLTAMVAYTFGHSKDITNGIRNSMESNWQLNPSLSPNNPSLANSNFDIRNRIVSTINYRQDWNTKGKYVSNFALFFSAATGAPFTYGIVNPGTNINNTGQQQSLIYIPKKGETINFFADQATSDAFDGYVDGNKYLSSRRGQFTERNAAHTPWNVQLDYRFTQDINFKVKGKQHTFTFTYDVINLTNLINKDWGLVYFSPNTFNSMSDVGLTQVTPGSPTVYPKYKWNPAVSTVPPYSIDLFASRFQMQAGLRYSF
ncbi:carboxypeptidase regulatory-like domain-containing protein [Parasediminibacterium sp. JCM 36343]|uniref:TonB-dependent receptor n=1 Tax=Parasediminibacterium sp. JCM 36343 TaxID=3374279 RepID=UPI00397BBFBE